MEQYSELKREEIKAREGESEAREREQEHVQSQQNHLPQVLLQQEQK